MYDSHTETIWTNPASCLPSLGFSHNSDGCESHTQPHCYVCRVKSERSAILILAQGRKKNNLWGLRVCLALSVRFLPLFLPAVSICDLWICAVLDWRVCVYIYWLSGWTERETPARSSHIGTESLLFPHTWWAQLLSLSIFLSQFVSPSVCLSLTAFWVTGSLSGHAHAPFSVHPASILATKLSDSAD